MAFTDDLPDWPTVVPTDLATEPRPAFAPLRVRLEGLVCILILFMLSDALIGPLFDPTQAGGDDNPWLRAIWLPAYAVTALAAAIHWRAMLRAAVPLLLISILVALAYASALWSIAPDVTLRRSLALLFTCLFGVYFGARWPWRQFVAMIAQLSALLALGSLFVCLFDPAMGIHQTVNAGDWRGLWFEKNTLGATMALGVLASVATALLNPSQRVIWTLNAVLCLGMTVMSRSGTALITIALIFGCTLILALMRRGPILAILSVFGAGLLGFAAALAELFQPDLVFKLLGKDPTLTGRTDIWAAVLRRVAEHPWLGFGYAAFWDKDSIPAQFIRRETGWNVPSAHNGWLDMLVQLGLVGVAACLALVLAGLALAAARLLRARDGNWALIYLGIFLITCTSESALMSRNSLPWALCVATLTKVMSERMDDDGEELGDRV